MAFIHDLEETADLCQLDITPFARDDAIRVAALAGIKDRNLAEKSPQNCEIWDYKTYHHHHYPPSQGHL